MTRPRFLPLLTALIVALAVGAPPGGTAASAAPVQGPGAVLLVGGALADDNSAVYGEFVRQAGGPGARIGVLS